MGGAKKKKHLFKVHTLATDDFDSENQTTGIHGLSSEPRHSGDRDSCDDGDDKV